MELTGGLISTDLLGKIFAFLCALLWALAVILFKKSGEGIKPLGLNLYKSFISSVLMIPVLIIAGTELLPANLIIEDYLIIIISGILGIALSDTLFFKSLNLLGAGLTAIVDCLYSPIIIFLSYIFLVDKITLKEFAGGILVITAILVATFKLKEKERSKRDIVFGFMYGTGAMVAMGVSVIMMKPVLDKTPILWVTEIRLVSGTVALAVFLYLNKSRKEILLTLIKRANIKYALPATILGSFLALILWISAFKMTSVSSAAILNQINTVFIVIFASVFLKEKFTVRRFGATVLGMGGSLLILIN